MKFYNPETISVYTTSDYKLYLRHHTITHFGITYNEDISVGIYTPYLDSDP